MIIFNTTLHLDDSVHDECLTYLKQVYIPRSLEGSLLHTPALFRVESQHEESGVSYALQFRSKDMETLEEWVSHIGSLIQQDLSVKFGDKVSGFATLLEEIPLD